MPRRHIEASCGPVAAGKGSRVKFPFLSSSFSREGGGAPLHSEGPASRPGLGPSAPQPGSAPACAFPLQAPRLLPGPTAQASLGPQGSAPASAIRGLVSRLPRLPAPQPPRPDHHPQQRSLEPVSSLSLSPLSPCSRAGTGLFHLMFSDSAGTTKRPHSRALQPRGGFFGRGQQ